MASSPPESKRARTEAVAACAPPNQSLAIVNLTDDILAQVASFLPKTSVPLLATALTVPSSSFRRLQWRGELSPKAKALMRAAREHDYPHGRPVGAVIDRRIDRRMDTLPASYRDILPEGMVHTRLIRHFGSAGTQSAGCKKQQQLQL